MRVRLSSLAFSAALATFLAGSVGAADFGPSTADRFEGFRFFDEVRVGGHWHNPTLDEKDTVDISGEILTSPINGYRTGNAIADALLNPRLHVGAMVNTRGLTSYAFTGVTWRADITEKLFAELEFGGALNNSPDKIQPNRITIGCPLTFHETAGIGYRVTSNVSVLFNVDHISHADLCGKGNPGLTDFGVKIGYRF